MNNSIQNMHPSKIIGVDIQTDSVKIKVENIKCGGCEAQITSKLKNLGLNQIEVSHETQEVVFQNPQNPALIDGAVSTLREMGYPVIDSEEGLARLALKVKSYASCAIGKFKAEAE